MTPTARGPRLSIIPAGAVTDSRLTPRALQVLCALGRHADTASGWLRIRQTVLAAEIGCARSTLQAAIDLLVDSGWVSRELVGREGCAAPDPGKQPYAAHAYRVRLDIGSAAEALDPFVETDECDAAPHDDEATGARPAGTRVPDQPAPGCRSMDRHPIERPTLNDERDARAKPVPKIEDFEAKWKTAAFDDRARSRRALAGLSDDEAIAAFERIDRWQDGHSRVMRTKLPALWKYLEERKWTLLPDEAGPPPIVSAAGWSREWWAIFHDRCRRGQSVAFMVEHAAAKGPGAAATVKRDEMPPADTIAALKGYPSDGPELARWRTWLNARGIRLPDWRERVWVFLPSPDPPVAHSKDNAA